MEKEHCDYCDKVILWENQIDIEIKMRGGRLAYSPDEFAKKYSFCSESCLINWMKTELRKRTKKK